MYARKVVPFLLIAGGVMMFMHHKRHELLEQYEEGEQHRPIGPCGEGGQRVPPLFAKWHQRVHELESQPAAI